MVSTQKEEDNLRAAVRKESHQKRAREKHSQRGLTASYLEPDNFVDDEVGGASSTDDVIVVMS